MEDKMDKSNEKIKDGELLAKLFIFFEQNLNNIKDDKLKAILKKVLITEFFLLMTGDSDKEMINYNGKEVRPMVSLPLNLYISFHERFNKGELFVYSGRKDGTNRKIGRNAKGILKDMNSGDSVWPFELFMYISPNSRSLSEFGKKQEKVYRATGNSNFTYLYDDNKDLIGIRFADGSEMKI